MNRIDDAVGRILLVKFSMGLFENPLGDLRLVNELGSQEHRDLAREAVRKSLVLLKNGKSESNRLLPIPKRALKIPAVGTHAEQQVCLNVHRTSIFEGYSLESAAIMKLL